VPSGKSTDDETDGVFGAEVASLSAAKDSGELKEVSQIGQDLCT
jgi:hypothetical protein